MKEAVVLILDANETMAATYEEAKSRFNCAKEVCLGMISDLMIRSKTNEVAVVVLKSPKTKHHFWHDDSVPDDQEIPFPNIVELGGDGIMVGVNRPHPDLLRQIQDLQVTSSSKGLRGDVCDGIVVAADALYQRTSGKKYQRRIVLITDAEHQVQVDSQQLLVVLDSLRAMECRLEVIGMEFESQAEFEQAADSQKAQAGGVKKEEESSKPEPEDDDSATEVEEGRDSDNDNDEDDRKEIKHQNEQLLLSLAEKTGGFVMAAKELQPIMQKVLGQRLPKSTRRKVQFQIAPGLVLDARFSLLLSRASAPTLKKKVVEIQEGERADDPDARVVKDEDGKEVTHDYQTIITHWDPEQDTRELDDITQAYRYGSDLVPMSGYDMTGLMRTSPVQLKLLGYLHENQVPLHLRIGPPYALAGADSLPACAAIAALAVALERKQQVGIATLVKTKDADPILVGLFPLNIKNDSAQPRHLCLMQLPFRGDVTNLSSLQPLVKSSNMKSSEKQVAADQLIDSLILPPEVLDHSRIPNPYLRSFHQTVVQRILKPDCGIVSVRSKPNQDPMSTPEDTLKKAQPAIDAFRLACPLTKVKSATTSNGGRKAKGAKNIKSYHDFVED